MAKYQDTIFSWLFTINLLVVLVSALWQVIGAERDVLTNPILNAGRHVNAELAVIIILSFIVGLLWIVVIQQATAMAIYTLVLMIPVGFSASAVTGVVIMSVASVAPSWWSVTITVSSFILALLSAYLVKSRWLDI